MDFQQLIDTAFEVLRPRRVSPTVTTSAVAAALVTEQGNVYRGVNIDTHCSLGFCAEHAAIAAMFTGGEDKPVQIVAVGYDGKIWAPCGRCRELLHQINPDCQVLMPDGKTILTAEELLPWAWVSPDTQEEEEQA